MGIFKTADCMVVDVTPYVSGVSQTFKSTKYAGKVTKIDPKFVYSAVIGITGDMFNENDDFWPWKETLLAPPPGKLASSNIRHQYQTWIGKPNCRNHINEGPEHHYGSVIDTWHTPDAKDVLMVLATDRTRNPKLVEGIENGSINSVSMGCTTRYTTCSVCGNIAVETRDYCPHIKYQKGHDILVNSGLNYYPGAKVASASTNYPRVHVGEICYDINGVEMSWVDNPAFPGCINTGILAKSKNASKLEKIMDPNAALRRRINSILSKIAEEEDPLMRETYRALSKAAKKKELTNSEVLALRKTLGLLEH